MPERTRRNHNGANLNTTKAVMIVRTIKDAKRQGNSRVAMTCHDTTMHVLRHVRLVCTQAKNARTLEKDVHGFRKFCTRVCPFC